VCNDDSIACFIEPFNQGVSHRFSKREVEPKTWAVLTGGALVRVVMTMAMAMAMAMSVRRKV